MFQQFFATLGRLYNFVMSLVVTAVLCVATWAGWTYYEDVRQQKQFAQAGLLRSVTIDQADRSQRSWRDVLSNSTYLRFRYQGKPYTARYVMDSGYVGAGDRVSLLYHAGYDAFRQLRSDVHPDQSTRRSRLVNWSSLRTFSNENQLLLLCLVLTSVSFFLLTGLIVTIVPVNFLQDIARLLLIFILLVVSIYFTYDTYQYVDYYQRLKANAQAVSVDVIDTDRSQYKQSNHSRHGFLGPLYQYQATVTYRQQRWIIEISKSDFETTKPGDPLRALHNATLGDLMSADYSLDYWLLAIPVCFWLITLVLIRAGFVSQRPKRPSGQ